MICRIFAQVAILGGIEVVLDSRAPDKPQLTEVPIDIEVLLTVSRLSLLETENPKHEAVVEISPVHVVLSERRLNLLRAAKTCVDFDVLEGRCRFFVAHEGFLPRRHFSGIADPKELTLSRPRWRTAGGHGLSAGRLRPPVVCRRGRR